MKHEKRGRFLAPLHTWFVVTGVIVSIWRTKITQILRQFFRFVHFEGQNNSEYLYSIEAWEKLFSSAEKCARASHPIAKF